MRVAFLSDVGNQDGTIGGAELTMEEFRIAAPDEVVFDRQAERVVVGNCVTYGGSLIEALKGKKVFRYHHDLSPHGNRELREWLDENATHIFCSPMHRERYGIDGEIVPPALDLDHFRQSGNGKRSGTCSVAVWHNHGKGAQLLEEWAAENGPVDVYGPGPFGPRGENLDPKGPLEPDAVAETLRGYERFVFLPISPEPFCRSVVEAWAAGLEIVTNRLVGALWWLKERPEGLTTAAEDFWRVVLA